MFTVNIRVEIIPEDWELQPQSANEACELVNDMLNGAAYLDPKSVKIICEGRTIQGHDV